MAVAPGLDVLGYRADGLHDPQADWPEKNCYVDLWIEALHALGLEPLAMLGHTVGVDFVGDQWTFFKPCHAGLRELYGIDVQELTVWRTLEEHALEHVAAGRWICTEADAFWLPDTSATDYRRKHTKTTILVNEIDAAGRRMAYFHNAGYFELRGEDYDALMRAGATHGRDFLPLFAELVHMDRCVRRAPAELAQRALRLLRAHFEWRPRRNPFTAFGERMDGELPAMRSAGLAHYHEWAFASIRQAGAAFELAAAHVRWLAREHDPAFGAAAEPFARISALNKALILKGARAVATGRSFDPREATSEMAAAWDLGMDALGEALAGS